MHHMLYLSGVLIVDDSLIPFGVIWHLSRLSLGCETSRPRLVSKGFDFVPCRLELGRIAYGAEYQ
jgi:hypothetical protein